MATSGGRPVQTKERWPMSRAETETTRLTPGGDRQGALVMGTGG